MANRRPAPDRAAGPSAVSECRGARPTLSGCRSLARGRACSGPSVLAVTPRAVRSVLWPHRAAANRGHKSRPPGRLRRARPAKARPYAKAPWKASGRSPGARCALRLLPQCSPGSYWSVCACTARLPRRAVHPRATSQVSVCAPHPSAGVPRLGPGHSGRVAGGGAAAAAHPFTATQRRNSSGRVGRTPGPHEIAQCAARWPLRRIAAPARRGRIAGPDRPRTPARAARPFWRGAHVTRQTKPKNHNSSRFTKRHPQHLVSPAVTP